MSLQRFAERSHRAAVVRRCRACAARPPRKLLHFRLRLPERTRLKLAAQTRPYFVKVADAAWVGYRKPLSGPGAWVARVGIGEGKGRKKTADDNGLKANGEKVLTAQRGRRKQARFVTIRRSGCA